MRANRFGAIAAHHITELPMDSWDSWDAGLRNTVNAMIPAVEGKPAGDHSWVVRFLKFESRFQLKDEPLRGPPESNTSEYPSSE